MISVNICEDYSFNSGINDGLGTFYTWFGSCIKGCSCSCDTSFSCEKYCIQFRVYGVLTRLVLVTCSWSTMIKFRRGSVISDRNYPTVNGDYCSDLFPYACRSSRKNESGMHHGLVSCNPFSCLSFLCHLFFLPFLIGFRSKTEVR